MMRTGSEGATSIKGDCMRPSFHSASMNDPKSAADKMMIDAVQEKRRARMNCACVPRSIDAMARAGRRSTSLAGREARCTGWSMFKAGLADMCGRLPRESGRIKPRMVGQRLALVG